MNAVYTAAAAYVLAAAVVLVLVVVALERRAKPKALTDYTLVETLPNYAESA